MNKQIIKAAQMASKVGHQAGAKKAHADNKTSYMDREGKTTVKRQPDGSYKKSVTKITPEQNQAEYDGEKNEKFYSKKTGKLEYIPTDDGEVQDRSGIEDWQLAPQRKSALNMLGISRKSSPLNFKGANSKNSKCWDGYKKVGTKPSPSGTGETVNDCKKI